MCCFSHHEARNCNHSSSHEHRLHCENRFPPRVVIKINGSHKFASAERVVCDEILRSLSALVSTGLLAA